MWRDRLVIYLEKQIYRHRVFPNGACSPLPSLVDDTFEGALLLSSVFQCGSLASDCIDDFPLFSFAPLLHSSEAKSSLGWGVDVTRKRMRVRGFFSRCQRSVSDLPR